MKARTIVLAASSVLACSSASPEPSVTSFGTGSAEITSTAEDETTDGSDSGSGTTTTSSTTSTTTTTPDPTTDSTGPGTEESTTTSPGVTGPFCVLPLGDSITQADSAHMSYRYWLWEQLVAAGWDVDFVGSTNEHYMGTPNYPNPDFDRDHEGHYGWTADQILAQLPGWLGGYTPSVVILHIGTNDSFFSQPVDGTLGEITSIVEALRADSPNVVVFIAQIIPLGAAGGGGANDRIDQLNAGIVGLGPQLTTEASPVFVLDRPEGFNPATDLHDGVHPNEGGEKKMANNFFAALDTAFQAGIVPVCP